jgi:hypothetical protein
MAAHLQALKGSGSADSAAAAVRGATGVDRGEMRRRVLAHRGRSTTQGDDR